MKTILSLSVALSLFVPVAFFATTTRAATPTFAIGQNVTTDGTTNVRATPDGVLLGTQVQGAIGTIAAGPAMVPGNLVTWYKVNFVTAPSGWVGGDMLVAAAPPAPVTLGSGTDQTMIVDAFGNIDVTWYDITMKEYFFSQSTNQGLTWSAPILLPMSPAQPMSPLGPSMAVESNGAIDVVYLCVGPQVCPGNPVDQSLQLIRSVDNGVTWSSPVMVSLPFSSGAFGANDPAIAACGSGIVITWQDDGIGSDFIPNQFPDIMLEYVVGGVPSPPINISNTPNSSEGHPQIVVNAQRNVFVTWVTSAGGGGIVFQSVPNCGAAAPTL
jgi:hypothetical protein